FNRKSQVKSEIPTASLPDIVFMLLFFFMVTTVLRVFTGLEVELPDAETIQKIESRRHTSYLWIHRSGIMSFNDFVVDPDDDTLYQIAYKYLTEDNQLIMSLKYDELVPFELVAKANNELRKAGALRVNFATDVKVR
ncbi:biopolymer transporter ExbD, partial [candidate division KSB1 bacterium]|nr:biopolymer transporter ExbD [candidate division KSB1 bacterium]